MKNVLVNFKHAPLSVKDNDGGWGGRSNFQIQDYPPKKTLENLADCIHWLERWDALKREWCIFDGATLTFYVSNAYLVERCKKTAKNYIKPETIDFDAINFVVGLPTV